jgi:hypothetical protein
MQKSFIFTFSDPILFLDPHARHQVYDAGNLLLLR